MQGWFALNVLLCTMEGSFMGDVEVFIIEGVGNSGVAQGVGRRFLSS